MSAEPAPLSQLPFLVFSRVSHSYVSPRIHTHKYATYLSPHPLPPTPTHFHLLLPPSPASASDSINPSSRLANVLSKRSNVNYIPRRLFLSTGTSILQQKRSKGTVINTVSCSHRSNVLMVLTRPEGIRIHCSCMLKFQSIVSSSYSFQTHFSHELFSECCAGFFIYLFTFLFLFQFGRKACLEVFFFILLHFSGVEECWEFAITSDTFLRGIEELCRHLRVLRKFGRERMVTEGVALVSLSWKSSMEKDVHIFSFSRSS